MPQHPPFETYKPGENEMEKRIGIYLHIPFCVQKCRYCDFCSFAGAKSDRMEAYVSELCRRIEHERKSFSDVCVDTIYFGGGTPTLLSVEAFSRIFDTLRASCKMSDGCEITCECNPATADEKKFRALRELGFNRLSIGLQSVHDEELQMLGRIHTYEDFRKTFSDARAAGFDNISVDLMYALPDQVLARFEESLVRLAELSPEHISVYGLKIEEGTPFWKQRDSLRLPEEETELAMYLACTEILSHYGYEKYEISNFSKKGRESRHNLRYWHGEEYLGFGVAAHSYFCGERFGNSRDIAAFLSGEDIVEERVRLDERELRNEYLMLRLRLSEGIDERELDERFGVRFDTLLPATKRLVEHGLLQRRGERISFTDRGFFVSNAILSELLEFEKKNC